MDTKLALECLSLFLLGVAYGAVMEAFVHGLRWRISVIRRNREN